MGGGGSGPGRIGDIQAFLEKAKQELRAGEAVGKRNVFISFAYEDLGAVNLLRGQAKNENVPLEFNDWSVSEPIDSERSAYIKERIADRINQSSVTVVFLSHNTPTSRWVDWEIEESIRRGKHVIGVYPQNSPPKVKPEPITRHAVKCVAWPDLADTIEKLP
jgi:hypothetical protein